jgi:hypothetical protein
MANERRLYTIFKKKIHEADQNSFWYKISDTLGLGGLKPFDGFLVIQGIFFAIEFKSKGGTLTKYQAYQLQEVILAGGEALVYWEGNTDMTYFINCIMMRVEDRKK